MVKEKELELEQLKKELENVNNVSLVFEPKLNEEYYWFDREGDVCWGTNENHRTDNYIFEK